MFELSAKQKVLIGIIITGVCFVAGFFFAYVYQPADKTMRIYSQAMQDYANGDFQNSYYLFSRVGWLSRLKPYAIYHQSMCAKELGDKKSELKQYRFLFDNFNKNVLSVRARYLAAQLLVEEDPSRAKGYFEYIIKRFPNTDYAIASEYYLGLITLNRYKGEKIMPMSAKNEIENYFRHYIEKAPNGRLALNAVSNWLTLDKEISSDDYLLMAKSCYLFEDYERAKSLLANTDLKDSWVLDVKNSYALKNYQRAKALVISGLQHFSNNTDVSDIYEAVDVYLKMSDSKKSDIDYLFEVSPAKGKDYIWSAKCYHTPYEYQAGCFKNLYINFPNGVYGADAMANVFFDRIKSKDYVNAQKIGKDYLNKFSKMSAAPMVMFWLGKISSDDYMSYYKGAISNYPDSYYAYRAYLAMRNLKATILSAQIQELPVVYPYKNVPDVILKLAELKDFEVLELISDDDFVRSWIYYEKGDYSHSMLVARDAMEKINPKPDRSDLRWRLVYPLNYYDDICEYAGSNNPILMLALAREESYFNPKATSAVGARGLMQLMPATAREISANYGFGMVSDDDLYKPLLNLKIGNAYYTQLRSMLNNLDISAIAAYNGGIGSIGNWRKNMAYSDTDDFVEQIPYAETKNYVKKVFRSYWNYLRIYAVE